MGLDKIVQIWVDFGVWCARTSSGVTPTNNYLPAIRCAMSWANDELLLADSNVIATVDSVLRMISDGRSKCSSI